MDITEKHFESVEAMDELLANIEKTHGTFEADPEDEEGRKQMRSVALQIAKKKTAIDDKGKALVGEWKRKAKAVDEVRKHARDTLDAMRDKVRKPADDYEAEQVRIAAEKQRAEEEAAAEAERKRIAAIEAREAEIAERERKLREAEEAQRRAEQDRIEAEQRAERERQEAERRAEEEKRREQERAERDERIRREAAEQAKRDAERKLREKAEREEAQRLREEADRRRQEEDAAHRKDVHEAILADLAAIGVNNGQAILDAILAGKVGRLRIDYTRGRAAA